MNANEREFVSHSAAETWAFAARLALECVPGSVIALHGDLGAGKTCLVQGLGRALEVREAVHSPTFTLVNEYRGRLPLHHIDLYRLASAAEAFGLGLDEYLDGGGVTVIEWAERAAPLLPARTIHIELRPGAGPTERIIRTWQGDAP